jgi:hypothetical protein
MRSYGQSAVTMPFMDIKGETDLTIKSTRLMGQLSLSRVAYPRYGTMQENYCRTGRKERAQPSEDIVLDIHHV